MALRADPKRSGPIVEVQMIPGAEPRYVVFHSAGKTATYFESQLSLVEAPPYEDRLLELIASDQWLTAEEFRCQLTAARLANPETESLYALQSARIQFIPFQFKPLLRFLRAEQPRLLIADEVGVGKTIEAGLIMRELQSRQDVGNVIVVCPKALVHKWRAEMLRFDEDFRPLTSETLKYCLNEAHLDGAWPSQFQRSIVHLELLRMEEHLSRLTELDPAPRFDLAIFDEAHHLRTPGTLSHELARYLCDVSEGVLFLSATPMQVASSNLHSLLNLLRPDLFPIEALFNEIMEPNEHVISAARHVRTKHPVNWQEGAANELRGAAATSWGSRTLIPDPSWQKWVEKLSNHNELTNGDRISCLRDLEELHSLAHVMNRTRRRDIGAFTVRDPVTVSVPFTETQQDFYQQLLAFREEILLLQHDPRVVRLILDTLERQASSCLPALAELLDAFLVHGRLTGVDLTDTAELDFEALAIPSGLETRIRKLQDAAAKLKGNDPKLDALDDIVRSTLMAGGPGKLLVFSFFIHTLNYLYRELTNRGLRVELITGGTPDTDRELLRDRFRLPRNNGDALDVLLSSEVGCEGLDYEFCDRLVNYDIPWNPMRIEQRIGRIDRFGQSSPKVMIYNFVTPGTVEERIFYRCFDRLDLFRQTVGDLEEVLGDLVDQLTQAALNPDVSPLQAEMIAQQAADNALREGEERRRLEEESDSLVGLTEVFMSDVNDVIDHGRFVPSQALRDLVDHFLRNNLDSQLFSDAEERVDRLRLDKDKRLQLRQIIRALKRTDRQTQAFLRWLDSSEPQLRITFDQEVALNQRDLTFVTAIHPLARAAVASMENQGLFISQLLAATENGRAGCYAFICELWEMVGIQSRVQLHCFAWDLKTDEFSEDISQDLLRYLDASTTATNDMRRDQMEDGFAHLESVVHSSWMATLNEVRAENQRLVQQRRAVLGSYHANRKERLLVELERLIEPKIVRMKQAEQSRIDHEYESKLEELDHLRDADVVTTRLAAGVLALNPETAPPGIDLDPAHGSP